MSDGNLDGVFPFGLQSGRCEPRRVKHAQALVLGVYPSALHVRWTHPRYRVTALAVAPEPWPFWDGQDEVERVAQWREQVGWRDEWGTAAPAGRVNGSSGQSVREQILAPLGVTLDGVWLTDALPFFHVHRGRNTQGAAMGGRYDVFAVEHGLLVHDLPTRPTPAALVEHAVAQESDRLRNEIAESDAPLLITLGDEALAVAAALVDGSLPVRLTIKDYGRRHRARTAEGRVVQVLPLVHPGQRHATWRAVHTEWTRSAQPT